MAPRVTKSKADGVDLLKPKTEKSKVVRAKTEKSDKTEKLKFEKKEKEPDKGERIKAVTGDEAMGLIVGYLNAQNRPYSATEVSANLHGKVSPSICSLERRLLSRGWLLTCSAGDEDRSRQAAEGDGAD
jgi:26S proteasome regulatory subunit (ATPase 3-interacting protein)